MFPKNIWAFQKYNRKNSLGYTCVIIFLNAQKSIYSHPKATFNGTTVTSRSKAAQSNRNPTTKVNIGSASFSKTIFIAVS